MVGDAALSPGVTRTGCADPARSELAHGCCLPPATTSQYGTDTTAESLARLLPAQAQLHARLSSCCEDGGGAVEMLLTSAALQSLGTPPGGPLPHRAYTAPAIAGVSRRVFCCQPVRHCWHGLQSDVGSLHSFWQPPGCRFEKTDKTLPTETVVVDECQHLSYLSITLSRRRITIISSTG